MPARVANCPSCGAEVEFKAGTSLVSICRYCSTAVARRGDDIGALEILGKVAPLADLGSPLSLGLRGAYKGRPFTLIGRMQLDHGSGPWNEWYAAFEDETWGWLAEAEGNVYLTFAKEAGGLPSYHGAAIGSSIRAGSRALSITERRRAKVVSGEGELPFAVTPGSEFRYCDLEGEGGVFGTIDYGGGDEPEAFYVGERVDYGALFEPSAIGEVSPGAAAGAESLTCPRCGAGIELRAPDESLRVTCGACDALLDCGPNAPLQVLAAEKPSGPVPTIPLGSAGTFSGMKWTVFGHLIRSVTVDGVRYAWEEYLLHADRRGYRWLVASNDHFMLVEPIQAGDVQERARSVTHQGRRFRHFQSGTASVDAIRGEFYWKVSVGERTETADYVDPPLMISRESSSEEVTWSLGRYLEKSEVERAFGLEKKKLRTPRGIAPCQPNPHRDTARTTARLGGAFSMALVALALVLAGASDDELVYKRTFPIATKPPDAAGAEAMVGAGAAFSSGAPVTTEPFQVKTRASLAIRVSADVNNAWLFVGGRLVHQATNRVESFGVDLRHYSGYVGGEKWSDGDRVRTVYLGDVEPGSYVFHLAPEWGPPDAGPTAYELEVREDVFFTSHAVTALILLWVLPFVSLCRSYSFEKRRWAESDYA